MAGEKVGFIGVGIMGGGMVRQVLRGGFEVSVFDPNPEAMASIVEAGARGATSVANAVTDADFVQVVLALCFAGHFKSYIKRVILALVESTR